MLPSSTIIAQHIITFSLAFHIISNDVNDIKIASIHKSDNITDKISIILMDNIEVFLPEWIEHYLSNSLEATNTLLHYVNEREKGKSLDNLALRRVFILEDINQVNYYTRVVISDE